MAIPYLIDELKVEGSRITANAHPRFRSRFLSEDFYAEYEDDVPLEDLDHAVLAIPFLLNVIPLVWLSGSAYRIRTLDAELATSLKEIREAFRRLYPDCAWEGDLIPDSTATPDPTPETDGAVLLFSGGLDSTYSALKHRDVPLLLITILSYLGQDRSRSERLSMAARAYFRKLSSELGQRSSFVRSNLIDFIPPAKLTKIWPHPRSWLEDVQLGLGFSGLAAPLMRRMGLPRLLLADGMIDPYGHTRGSIPAIVNSTRWSGGSVQIDGLERTRQEKLHFVRGIWAEAVGGAPAMKPCLYPVDGFENCCRCSKCHRTIAGILADGGDPRMYGFDVDPCLALSTLRREFASHTVYMPHVTKLLAWRDIQVAACGVLHSPQFQNLPVSGCAEDLLWFSKFDLARYFVRYHSGFRRVLREARSRLGLVLDSWPPAGRAIRRMLRRLP